MTYRKIGSEFSSRTKQELDASDETRQVLLQSLEQMGPKWDAHLPLFLSAPSMARLLWLDLVYCKALDLPGCFVEFGSQWGASMNVFLLLKLIHEPWNAGRRIISFSIFEEGFNSVEAEDGPNVSVGDYHVQKNWEEQLERILRSHSLKSPLAPEQNFEIHPGDAASKFKRYLEHHPETVISHAHFDLDLYKPTRDVLELCLTRMPKGAVLIFDEINCPSFPGETVAVEEILGIANLSLRKSPFQPYSAYTVIGT